MTNNKFPLHLQIVIALILGAIFGSIFGVNQSLISINYKMGGSIIKGEIKSWDTIISRIGITSDSATFERKFGSDDQIQLINWFKNLTAEQKPKTHITVYKNEISTEYSEILSLYKEQTIATAIKPIGTIFIRLLSFLAIPLVIASLIVGAASLEDIKKLGRIGGKTFILFMGTTVLAITIGLISANIIRPGEQITENSKNRLLGEYQSETSSKINTQLDVDIIDFIVNIVPKNPIRAMSDSDMLQIVFFAVMFGATITFLEKKKTEMVVKFFDGVSEIMIRMVGLVMKLAPFGVFALISATIAEFGYEIIATLFWYMFTVLMALLLHTILVYSFVVKVWGRMSPFTFFKGMQTAQVIAFSSSSSAATLPVTMDCTENKLGIPKQITGFVLPLGATINMDGTALYQGVAAVFIAQVYGMDLSLVQQLTIIFTAVLASIGTAPVPGVGIIMLIMILEAVHIPPEGIALIIGVDRILDMCRTITNITGDASVAVAVWGTEKRRAANKNLSVS